MKKILLILSLSMISLTTFGQTKEETITYLDKVLKMSIGYKIISDTIQECTITSALFRYDKIEIVRKNNDLKPVFKFRSYYTDCYTSINWESLSKIETMGEERMDSLLVYFFVKLDNKVRYDAFAQFETNTSETGMDDDMHYPNYITLFVLKAKAESFKKAIERLVVIAKEENKNPFED